MLSQRQQHCLQGIGIARWLERPAREIKPAADQTLPKAIEANSPLVQPPILDNWDSITQSIHQCTACELSNHCTRKVPGTGSQQASLMLIGEGPGHEEDIRGEPFVGRSGQLLDKMLVSIGLTRSQVFITNIVKCRPPGNRDPHTDEVQACASYLQAQIRKIAPKVILCVGRISAHHLLHTSTPVGKLVNQVHQLPGSDIPLLVTYHPAYLLRNPSAKSIAWNDMKILHQKLGQ